MPAFCRDYSGNKTSIEAMKNAPSVIILFLLAGSWVTSMPARGQALETPSLKAHTSWPLGVAIGYKPMTSNATYRNIIIRNFDNVTFEYALKNGAIVRKDGSFDYSRSDTLVNLCKKYKLQVYGHTLCWYQNNSPYLSTLNGDSAKIEQFLVRYITTTLKRYKNYIHAWDVVNEAIDSTGQLRMEGKRRPDYFYWGKYLGVDYVARAFQYAHDADPKAALFYNDYNLESNPLKLAGVIRMVKQLKESGIPINGIGTQMHITIATPDSGIDRAFRALASTGLFIRISELDIRENTSEAQSFRETPYADSLQAAKWKYVFQSYDRNIPASQRYGITCWNLGTLDSWIPKALHLPDSPTLFDRSYKPKPAYFAILNMMRRLKPLQTETN